MHLTTNPRRAGGASRARRSRPLRRVVDIAAAVLGAELLAAACATAGRHPASAAPSSVPALRLSIDSMLAEPKWRSMQWGILIVDAERGDTLYSHNAGKLLIPASNQKLITGAVALHLLGPNFRFTTTLAARGAVHDRTLSGDLVVLGQGDPSVSDHMAGDAMTPLRAIADSIAARGIRTVTGVLASGNDLFPGSVLGSGWEVDDLDAPYAAGVDELYFNEGFTRLQVTAGARAGDAVRITTAPMASYPAVTMHVRTVAGPGAPHGDERLTVRQDSARTGAVIVDGEIAAGDSATLAITYQDQRAAYLSALRQALEEKGVHVEGGISSSVAVSSVGEGVPAGASEPPWYPLFSVASPPLREVMRAFEKPSQNQIGEILYRTIGRAGRGSANPDGARSVVAAQLLAWGAAPDGFVINDGSGLSRHDLVTPETLAHVLSAMRGESTFAIFHDALPIAGVDGTIGRRMRGSAAEGKLHAKTGTLDMVRSLSGYITSADGRPLIVVLLANNWVVPTREVETVQDAIAVKLATLQLERR